MTLCGWAGRKETLLDALERVKHVLPDQPDESTTTLIATSEAALKTIEQREAVSAKLRQLVQVPLTRCLKGGFVWWVVVVEGGPTMGFTP